MWTILSQRVSIFFMVFIKKRRLVQSRSKDRTSIITCLRLQRLGRKHLIDDFRFIGMAHSFPMVFKTIVHGIRLSQFINFIFVQEHFRVSPASIGKADIWRSS